MQGQQGQSLSMCKVKVPEWRRAGDGGQAEHLLQRQRPGLEREALWPPPPAEKHPSDPSCFCDPKALTRILFLRLRHWPGRWATSQGPSSLPWLPGVGLRPCHVAGAWMGLFPGPLGAGLGTTSCHSRPASRMGRKQRASIQPGRKGGLAVLQLSDADMNSFHLSGKLELCILTLHMRKLRFRGSETCPRPLSCHAVPLDPNSGSPALSSRERPQSARQWTPNQDIRTPLTLRWGMC